MKLTKILLPTDFSANSYEGLRTAEVLADQSGASLVIVHVLDPSGKHGDWPTTDAARQHIEQLLQATMPAYADIAVEHALLEGDTAEEITRYARQQQVDLIVMGSHGRSGLPRALLGSVSSQILNHASCSVLTVRPKVRIQGEIKAWAHRKPHPGESQSPAST